MQREREAEVQAQQVVRGADQASRGVSSAGGKGWNEEDLPLLIKAVNLFPAGTNARSVDHKVYGTVPGFGVLALEAICLVCSSPHRCLMCSSPQVGGDRQLHEPSLHHGHQEDGQGRHQQGQEPAAPR